MRILNVTQSYAPFDEFGGPPAKVRALSEGLTVRGHEVTVLTADWGLEKRLAQMREGSAERCPFGWRRNVAGTTAIYLPTWLRYHATSWNPAVKRFCRARLRNFDVVHIFGLYDLLGPAVAAFCRRLGIRYVVEPIGMFVPIVRNLRMKRVYHALFGKSLFDGSAAVIATSEQERSALTSGGIPPEKIVWRRNGVTLPGDFPNRGKFRAAHGIPAEAQVVLFLGRLSSKKSPDLLLRAFAELTSRLREREPWLVFAGPDGEGMKENLQRTAARLGISSRMRFTGPVYGDEKWSAYRDADVFVLPSQNENFGNTALEAAGAGTPVIISEQCGVASLLRDAAMVVPHDEGALREAMEQILDVPQYRQRLSAAGRETASRLGWREPLEQMEGVYTKLAQTAPASGQSERQR